MTFVLLLLIPGSITLAFMGIYFLQEQKFQHGLTTNGLKNTKVIYTEFEEMKKEFIDYKKRVDALTIKAGFKL